MTAPGPDEGDPRIGRIIEALYRISTNDFSEPLVPSERRDALDAIGIGINAMSVELAESYLQIDHRVESRTKDLAAAIEALRELTLTDHLTGVGNRLALEQALGSRLEEMGDGGAPPVIVFLDLDHFKQINDHLGHQAGDETLRNVADLLRGGVRTEDGVFRLGGDEFALLLGNQAHVEDAMGLCQRLIRDLEHWPVSNRAQAAVIAFSCGVAVARPGSTVEDLTLEADTAMYVSKRSTSTKVHAFEDSMLWARRRATALTDDLRDGMTSGHVVRPYYQPIVDLATGYTAFAEALLRWEHPRLGLVSPDEILPLARQANLMRQVTESMIEQVLDEIVAWRARGIVDAGFRVSINVEAAELKSLSFVEFVAAALQSRDLPGEVITLEITENLELSGGASEEYALEYLCHLGIRLSIDDFGTGYSAIAYLQNLPARSAKVDRTLIVGIDGDPQKRRIAAAILHLVHASGLRSVAEGIETVGLASAVTELGFDFGQGFHFGRPMPAAEFVGHLQQRRAPAAFDRRVPEPNVTVRGDP